MDMLYTKIKRYLHLSLLGIVFFTGQGSAKSLIVEDFKPPAVDKTIWMDSISVNEMQLDFSEYTKAGQLSGRVFGVPRESQISKALFRLKSPDGAIFLEKEVSIESMKRGVLHFNFSIEGIAISESTILEFEIYGGRGRLAGKTEKIIPRQENFVTTKLSELSIELKNGKREVAYTVRTADSSGIELTPVVELYDRTGGTLLKTIKGPLITGALSNVSIQVPEPSVAQVYTIKVSVENKDNIKVGGILEKRFYVEGLFAEIDYFDLLDEDLKSKKVSFVFAGATLPVDGIEASILVDQRWDGNPVDTLKKTMPLEMNPNGSFRDVFTFELTNDADFFIADIELRKDDKVIGSRHLERKMFIAPNILSDMEAREKNAKMDARVEKVKWWMRKDWLLYGGAIILLFIVAINGWLRLHRKLFIALLGLMFFSGQTLAFPNSGVGAQVWWTHPVTSWFFNPSPDTTGVPNVGFEHYAKIRMNASILSSLLLDSVPLFAPGNTKPGYTLVRLTKGAQDGYVAVDMTGNFDGTTGDGFSVTDNIRFEFELNTSVDTLTDGTLLQTFLTEGDWDYELYLCIGGTGSSCSGGSWYATMARTLKIDRLAPALDLVHDNEVTQALHKPKITANKALLAIKIGDRDAARTLLLSKKAEKREKSLQLAQKVNRLKPYKLLKKDDLTKKRNILTFKLNQVNNYFTTITPLDLPQSCTQLFAIRKDQLMSQSEVDALCASRNQFIASRNTVITRINTIETELITINTDIDLLETQITTLDVDIQSIVSGIDALEDLVTNESIPDLQQKIKGVKLLSKSKTDGVVLKFSCNEVGGSGCMETNYEINVRGNFCDDSEFCNTTGTRKIKVCDKAGNCIDPEAHLNNIDWYDSVKPEASGGGFPSALVGATEEISFGLTNIKDLRRSLTSTESSNATADYNPDACGYTGDGVISPLFDNGSYCIEKFSTCATSAIDRGEQDIRLGGSCGSLCEPGYIYDAGVCYLACDQRNLELCLPGILGRGDCIDDPLSWSPDTSTWPNGTSFMQENNCGKRRQAVGSA